MSRFAEGKGAVPAPEKGIGSPIVACALALATTFVTLLVLSTAAGAQGYYSQPQADQPENQMTQAPAPAEDAATTYAQPAQGPAVYEGQQYTPAPPAASVSTGAQSQQGTAVSIQDFFFAPAQITVTPGTTVTWTNDGQAPHTVTADDGSFDSETVQPGGSFSFTFMEPGTFSYFCEIHPFMTGSVVVSGGAAPAQQATVTRDHSLPATGGPSLPVAGTVLLLGFGLACCAATWRIRRGGTRRKNA